ncbi:hypothetical protein HQ584_04470 [Patescibacteria group bacterium]|nr:hypothetical protein [Patescibacteria group bacterium]
MNHRLLLFGLGIIVYYFFIIAPALASENYSPSTLKAEFLRGETYSSFLQDEKRAILTYQDIKIVADKIEVNLDSFEIWAQGDIFLKVEEYEVRGKSLWFSLKKREGTLTLPWGKDGPIIFKAEKSKFSSGIITLWEGEFTTCDLSLPHYRVKAKQVQIIPEEKITARNATVYIGSLPVFWMPLFIKYLPKSKEINEIIFPRFGYNDFTGWYVKTGYQFYISSLLGGTFHFDYLSECGWGTGIDLSHQSKRTRGNLESYYIKEKDSKKERGMGRLRYWQALSNFSCLKLRLDYFTDEEFLEDYFPGISSEKREILPSFLSFNTWGENRNFRLIFQPKINPFPEEEWEEMLPQIKFNLLSQKIGKGSLYIQGTTKITNFKEEAKDLIDSSLDISHPFTLFNYLQFKPRIGWHLFYYPKEKEEPKYSSINYQNYEFFLRLKGKWGKFSHQVSPHLIYYHSNKFLKLKKIYPDNSRDFLELRVNNDFYLKQKKIINSKFNLGYNFTKQKFTPIETNINFGDYLNVDLLYEPYQEVFKLIGTSLEVRGEKWYLNLGFREYTDVEENIKTTQLSGRVRLNLGKKWRISSYVLYDIQKREIKEISYSIWRDLHCWTAQLSITERVRKNYSIVFYIKAFPQFKIGSF